MNEVIVRYLALPMSVNGLVTPTPEGDYQVILNARHSPQMQRETYRHELRHILLNHFSQDAEALAPLERAASLTQLPGEQAPRKARLEEAIRRAEDSGLSKADFAPEKPLPNDGISACGQNYTAINVLAEESKKKMPAVGRYVEVWPAEQKQAGNRAAENKPAALALPSAETNAALLRAMRAQLTGLHY